MGTLFLPYFSSSPQSTHLNPGHNASRGSSGTRSVTSLPLPPLAPAAVAEASSFMAAEEEEGEEPTRLPIFRKNSLFRWFCLMR